MRKRTFKNAIEFTFFAFYCYAQGLPVRILCIPSKTLLQKTKFLTCKKLSTADSWFGGGLMSVIPLNSRTLFTADIINCRQLVQGWGCVHYPSQFQDPIQCRQALCMMALSLGVHVGVRLVLRRSCFLGVLHSSWLSRSSCLLSLSLLFYF